MQKASKKQAIRNAFSRLGMQTKPKDVVRALDVLGIQVNEELVRLVRIELVKDGTRGRFGKFFQASPSPLVRRSPKEFPRRQHQR